jgi:hypothetical protein
VESEEDDVPAELFVTALVIVVEARVFITVDRVLTALEVVNELELVPVLKVVEDDTESVDVVVGLDVVLDWEVEVELVRKRVDEESVVELEVVFAPELRDSKSCVCVCPPLLMSFES